MRNRESHLCSIMASGASSGSTPSKSQTVAVGEEGRRESLAGTAEKTACRDDNPAGSALRREISPSFNPSYTKSIYTRSSRAWLWRRALTLFRDNGRPAPGNYRLSIRNCTSICCREGALVGLHGRIGS